MRSRITGTGSSVPAKILSNADLENMVATSDQWITERTGIRARYVVGPGEACSDLAVKAARRALDAARISAADLDMILLATCTGDYPLPATACLIQHQLGATKAAACDLAAACCGFVYALSMADAYVRTGMTRSLRSKCASTEKWSAEERDAPRKKQNNRRQSKPCRKAVREGR